jgi:hypothetical protein
MKDGDNCTATVSQSFSGGHLSPLALREVTNPWMGGSKKLPPMRVTHFKNRTTSNQELRSNKYKANFQMIYRLKK